MADLKNLTLQFTNPQTKETFDGYMKTSEDLVMLADGTTLRDLKESIWATIATQAYLMLQHRNAPHLTTEDLADLIAAVTYDDTTGTLSVETRDGNKTDIASDLNKSVSAFTKFVATAEDTSYTEGHVILKLELVNGDTYGVDLTDFVNDNIKIGADAYTVSYTEDTMSDMIDQIAGTITGFDVDPTSNIPNTVFVEGTVCEIEAPNNTDGNTDVTISFVLGCTGDRSTATAKLFVRPLSDSSSVQFTSKAFTSDGNTTPKFTQTNTFVVDDWYEAYVVIYDTVGGVVDTMVYRSRSAVFKFSNPADAGTVTN